MNSVVLNMAAGVMQFHETADEEQKQVDTSKGWMLASPVAAIVLNHGLQRLAKLVSLSSPCSPNATVSNILTTRGDIYQACPACGRPVCVANLKQHMDNCGQDRLGSLVQLQPVRHGPRRDYFSATNASCIWMQ
jgi:hypothetical protein